VLQQPPTQLDTDQWQNPNIVLASLSRDADRNKGLDKEHPNIHIFAYMVTGAAEDAVMLPYEGAL
jgi:hypothetical protein